ncbi:EthD family reductase [Gordonia sp. L191]|uniref:EthD family reductase n=1 Tax=Gordonia sp. L191 TaxID=2982699 RepID=UPI0024BF531E|nr:EthD family reductase [Gordonia sp. L191]WHU47729.1 EthD family reductase [Gordonia sp. L191]
MEPWAWITYENQEYSMYRVNVLYGPPDDREQFISYYENTHLPLAKAIPGSRNHAFAFNVSSLGEESPFFAVFSADFESFDKFEEGMASAEGKMAAADIANFASGGATIIHYQVMSVGLE